MAGHIADSGRVDWNTPDTIKAPLHQLFKGPPALDPCSNDGAIIGASTEYKLSNGKDGLKESWDFPSIYVNPPFGRSFVNVEKKLCYSAAEWNALHWWKEQLAKHSRTGGLTHTEAEILVGDERADKRKKLLQVLTDCSPANPQLDLDGFVSQNLKQWVVRCAAAHADHGSDVVLLVPAAVDTSHWQDIIWKTATAICFPKGRLKFIGADQSAPMACALAYWGRDVPGFCLHFEQLGHVEA